MRVEDTRVDNSTAVRQHFSLLGHNGYGVTELRTFEKRPMVAYADNESSVLRLCEQVNRRASGIYVGVQPRPMFLFDKAPNRWRPAISNPESNCARDRDIEFVAVCYWDLDTTSEQRNRGHPASEEELQSSYEAAQLLCWQEGLALSASIGCSGNGHHVLAPLIPIPVYSDDVALKFRCFCQQLAKAISRQVTGVRIDPVYNISRVTRLMGTVNRKGQAAAERPRRRAFFVTEPVPARSVALHHMILGTETPAFSAGKNRPRDKIRCDLLNIERCEFISWCGKHPD